MIKGMLGGPGLFGGTRVMPHPHWPVVEDGTRIVRYPAHPIIKWLARWLPITPYIEAEYTKYRDADPLMDERQGILRCSLSQADTLRREIQAVT